MDTLTKSACFLLVEKDNSLLRRLINGKTLVLYGVGAAHNLGYMELFAKKAWKEYGIPVMHQYNNGYFFTRFNTVEECDKVLANRRKSEVYFSEETGCK